MDPSIETSRFEKSLGLLTTRFVQLLQAADYGILDLKVVTATILILNFHSFFQFLKPSPNVIFCLLIDHESSNFSQNFDHLIANYHANVLCFSVFTLLRVLTSFCNLTVIFKYVCYNKTLTFNILLTFILRHAYLVNYHTKLVGL